MNNTVTATGMVVKAQAESGLLINEVSTANDTYWDDSATALANPGTALVPTSTTNGAKWFHANSKIASDEAGATSNTASTNLSGWYEELSLTEAATPVTEGAEGTRKAAYSVYYVNNNGTTGYQENSTDTAHYVMFKYYLKVSNSTGINNFAKTNGAQNVAIKEVKATLPQTPNSADLDKALRVGIKMGGKMYIYAPVYGTDQTSAEYFAVTAITNTDEDNDGVDDTQAISNSAVGAFATNTVAYTDLTSLNGMPGAGTEVDVYIWFEGEDDNCQSDKITDTLDDISVEVKFALVTLDAAAAAAAAAVTTAGNNEF